MYTPPFITETDEDPPWTDCVPASALMAALKASRGAYPATRAERWALEAAAPQSGFPDGYAWMEAALRNRYGLHSEQVHVSIEDCAQYAGADGFLIAGFYNALPDHLRRWQPDGTFIHSVFVQRIGRLLHWMDPLAQGTYQGEPVELDDIAAYYYSQSTPDVLIVREQMIPAASYRTPLRASVRAGCSLYNDPDRISAVGASTVKTGCMVIALPKIATLPNGKAALALVILDTDPTRTVWVGRDCLSGLVASVL